MYLPIVVYLCIRVLRDIVTSIVPASSLSDNLGSRAWSSTRGLEAQALGSDAMVVMGKWQVLVWVRFRSAIFAFGTTGVLSACFAGWLSWLTQQAAATRPSSPIVHHQIKSIASDSSFRDCDISPLPPYCNPGTLPLGTAYPCRSSRTADTPPSSTHSKLKTYQRPQGRWDTIAATSAPSPKLRPGLCALLCSERGYCWSTRSPRRRSRTWSSGRSAGTSVRGLWARLVEA